MAGGRGILDSSGRLLIRSDGTVDVCEDCCGCPSSLNVTLSTLTICTGCDDSGGSSFDGVDGGSLDGTYLVPYGLTSSGLCRYSTDTGIEAYSANYLASPCDGVQTSFTRNVNIIVNLFEADATVRSLSVQAAGARQWLFFKWNDADATAPGGLLGATLNNQNGSCFGGDYGGGFVFSGTGGTAEVVRA